MWPYSLIQFGGHFSNFSCLSCSTHCSQTLSYFFFCYYCCCYFSFMSILIHLWLIHKKLQTTAVILLKGSCSLLCNYICANLNRDNFARSSHKFLSECKSAFRGNKTRGQIHNIYLLIVIYVVVVWLIKNNNYALMNYNR